MSTIKEVAQAAGVSIATVSHVINKTRFVSPELSRRVELAMNQLEYNPYNRTRVPSEFKSRYVGLFYPEDLFDLVSSVIQNLFGPRSSQYSLVFCSIPVSKANISRSILNYYIKKMNFDGVVVFSAGVANQITEPLLAPSINVNFKTDKGINASSDIVVDLYSATAGALTHLSNQGHTLITVVHDSKHSNIWDKVVSSSPQPNNVSLIQLTGNDKQDQHLLRHSLRDKLSSAYLLMDKPAELAFLSCLASSSSIEIPKDYSAMFIRLTDELNHYTQMLIQPARIASTIVSKLQRSDSQNQITIQAEYSAGNSLAPIAQGPHGEKAADVSALRLSSQELKKLQQGSYSVGVCFHQSDTLWSKLHERGIRDILNAVGIPIISVMYANFDANLQNEQHRSLLRMGVDAIISIPVDEKLTVPSYREIIESNTRLVLSNNVPDGIDHDSYVSCISVNEQKSGAMLAQYAGNFMREHHLRKIGLIQHGANFFTTRQRDRSFYHTLVTNFSDIIVSDSKGFGELANVRQVTHAMLSNNPGIQALYVCWEEPAREVLHVLRQMGRTDIKVFTTDLSIDIASELARGDNVVALTTQQFYEQGKALAEAVLCSFLGKRVPPYIAIEPALINADNLQQRWETITKVNLPANVSDILTTKDNG